MENCLFCRIVNGEVPSVKVYEDDLVLAFLDLFPINFGHVLVIPKEHHTSAATIPEATAGRMFYVGARIGAAMRHGLEADGFNFHLSDGTTAGQVVMHAHLHIVPRWADDGFHWNWRQLKYESEEKRIELCEKIKARFKLVRDDAELAANNAECDPEYHSPLANDDPAKHGG